jgi:hypothetical protein
VNARLRFPFLAWGLMAIAVLAPGGLARPAAAVAAPAAVFAAPAAAAARDELRLETTSTYTLDPEAGAVHVSVNVRATNLKPNLETETTITRYYYRELSFALHPEATRVRATQDGVVLGVDIRGGRTFARATVQLASQLDYRETARLEVRYDLPGGQPRSRSDIRVGVAFATFYAWAHGDDGLSRVRVVLPASFEDEVQGATTRRSVRGGRIIHEARAIADVARWYLVVVAHREPALTADRLPFADRAVVVHAWPEDDRWRFRVQDVLRRGLPQLQELVGLPWPVSGTLDVVEVHTPLLEGYAGVFLTSRHRIEISEDLDDLTILHEASHAWFDQSLFVERWIYEGLADEYASRALRALGVFETPRDGTQPTDAAAVPLNSWTHPGRIADEETDAREAYGYNASWLVMRRLIDDVGAARMREVLAAADRDEIAYRGDGAPERVNARDDWRRFLDLLEEVGNANEAETLFRDWVVDAIEIPLLDERAEARAEYAGLAESAGDWTIPYYIRYRMGGWEFDLARERIVEAGRILVARDTAARLATGLGLGVPPGLEAAWEEAETDLEEADAIADAQVAGLRGIDRATKAMTAPRDVVRSLGLLGGTSPELPLAHARTAFQAGDFATAVGASDEAVRLLASASEVGRIRLAAVAGGGAGMLVLVGLYSGARLRRRRNTGGRAVPESSVTPYATGAGQLPAFGREQAIEPLSQPSPPLPRDPEAGS